MQYSLLDEWDEQFKKLYESYPLIFEEDPHFTVRPVPPSINDGPRLGNEILRGGLTGNRLTSYDPFREWRIFVRYDKNKNSACFEYYRLSEIYPEWDALKKSIKRGLKEFKGIPIEKKQLLPAFMGAKERLFGEWKPTKKFEKIPWEHEGEFEREFPNVSFCSSNILFAVPNKLIKDMKPKDKIGIYYAKPHLFPQPYIKCTIRQFKRIYPDIHLIEEAFEGTKVNFRGLEIIRDDSCSDINFDQPLLPNLQ